MPYTVLISLLAGAALAAENVGLNAAGGQTRRYNTNAKRVEGMLNVHMIPHTHDDVGWLKTIDQYFYGANNSIQHANVQSIIDAALSELVKDSSRTFTYVEQAFFQRWWRNRPEVQPSVRALVASGQLVFTNGGLCMHDEATTSAVDMVDQTTAGHRWLQQNLNVTPRTTSQIDPFGHSTFQGSMMASPLAGMNGMFFARADYIDAGIRFGNKSAEFFWYPSTSQGTSAASLGSLSYYYYYAPPGFNFGGDDNVAPVCDDPTLADFNVQSRVDDFVAVAQQQAGATLGNDVMWQMGTDFSYENAATWYNNIDKIIHYANLDGRVNAFYSTPQQYFDTKLSYGASLPLPVKTDDYMPLVDGPHSVWAGYYASRVAFKGYVRDSSRVHAAARQMQIMCGGAADTGPSNPLYPMEQAMGVAQHHDAVSGTEKQHVAYDYAQRLAGARLTADAFMASCMQTLTRDASAAFMTCDLANVTICPAIEAGVPTIITLWNSRAHAGDALVRIPVGTPSGVASYAVYDATAAPVTAQMLPLSDTDTHLRSEYYNYTTGGPVAWLAFMSSAPAVGFTTYFIVPANSTAAAPHTHASTVTYVDGPEDSSITNGVVTITLSATSGLVNSYTQLGVGTIALAQSFSWYNSSIGVINSTAPQGQQPSGAYIFRPNSSTVFPVASTATVTLVQGPVVQEARQSFTPWASQVVRLVVGALSAEFEYTIGPIPFQDGLGKEIVTRYSTPLASNGSWVTDSNTRDGVPRKRNYRSSFPINITEPVAQNYVPINAFTFLSDPTTQRVLSVATDRSQGGTSLNDGELEVMIHRRLQADDNRGVAEPLNETGLDGNGIIVRGVHRVSINTAADAGSVRRDDVDALAYAPTLLFSGLSSTPAAWIASHTASSTLLQSALPPQIHAFTLHSWGPKTLLLRLSHQFDVGEDATLSANATVAIGQLFAGIKIAAVTEMTLTANQPLASAPKVTYTPMGMAPVTLPIVPPAPVAPDYAVTLSAMQIRTFMCTLA